MESSYCDSCRPSGDHEDHVTSITTDEMKRKLDESQAQLNALKNLTQKALGEFDQMNAANKDRKAECGELQRKLQAAEMRIKELENVLEPACEEFGQMKEQYEIEKDCRLEAEKYAAKMNRQYGMLKRKSQSMLQKFSLVPFTEEVDDEVDSPASSSYPESPGIDVSDQRHPLNIKIQAQEEVITTLKDKLQRLEDEKIAAYELQVQQLKQIDELKFELGECICKEREQQDAEDNMNRVSLMAAEELEELQDRYNQEALLRCEAEKFASQMLSERDAIKRESSLILSSACADERLAAALLAIEDLMATLEAERLEHRRTRKQLEEALESSDLRKMHIELETKFELMASENNRLQRAAIDAQNWKRKLEKENQELIDKLDVTEQRLRPAPIPSPPPPPPPPPPVPQSPLLRFFKIKKHTSNPSTGDDSANVTGTKVVSPKEKTYEQAMQEMMDRIKSGRALKNIPIKEHVAPENTDGPAIVRLQHIATNLKKSRQSSTYSSPDQPLPRSGAFPCTNSPTKSCDQSMNYNNTGTGCVSRPPVVMRRHQSANQRGNLNGNGNDECGVFPNSHTSNFSETLQDNPHGSVQLRKNSRSAAPRDMTAGTTSNNSDNELQAIFKQRGIMNIGDIEQN